MSTCMFRMTPPAQPKIGFIKNPPPLSGKTVVSISSIGFKANRFRAKAYKIKLVDPAGIEREFNAPADTTILDAAEEAGVDLPCCCRAGTCNACVGKIETGSVDHSDGTSLDDDQLKEGYVLPCVAYPTSDCVIHTHKESDLY